MCDTINYIDQIYKSNHEGELHDFKFKYRTDSNAEDPLTLQISDNEEILFYHDMYIDGPLKYSRSYRYIRFTDSKKKLDEIRSTHHEMFDIEHLKRLLLTDEERIMTGEISSGIIIETIGAVNEYLLNKYYEMYEKGELPEDWEGLLFLSTRPQHKNKRQTFIGYLYSLKDTTITFGYE